ncbi:MAG: ornithine carbamoyltransferase [Desulfobacterales bacterium]|nr:MAG: ornithine carbamoyltransferase [Desulfobacterales bacterium]
MSRHLLSIMDLEKTEIDALLDRAVELKQRAAAGKRETALHGKCLGLLFDKASTRTRLSFETAMIRMGGQSIFISAADTQIARGEPIRDTVRVMSGYLDGLIVRTYAQDTVREFAEWAEIPVISGLTDLYHPCQILSDLLTVVEKKGGYAGLKIAWVGDGNNVAHSWINAAARLGFSLRLGCPEECFPNEAVLAAAREAGADVEVLTDPAAAVEGADVLNTDVWASMGQEDLLESRKQIFLPYQLNQGLLSHADSEAIVLHCLPAHREEEITSEVLEGPQSAVWDQAENKMHLHKALLEMLLA